MPRSIVTDISSKASLGAAKSKRILRTCVRTLATLNGQSSFRWGIFCGQLVYRRQKTITRFLSSLETDVWPPQAQAASSVFPTLNVEVLELFLHDGPVSTGNSTVHPNGYLLPVHRRW